MKPKKKGSAAKHVAKSIRNEKRYMKKPNQPTSHIEDAVEDNTCGKSQPDPPDSQTTTPMVTNSRKNQSMTTEKKDVKRQNQPTFNIKDAGEDKTCEKSQPDPPDNPTTRSMATKSRQHLSTTTEIDELSTRQLKKNRND